MINYCLHFLVFAVSFFWMLDFIVRSQVSTQSGLFMIFGMYIFISCFYYFYVSQNLKKCSACNHYL